MPEDYAPRAIEAARRLQIPSTVSPEVVETFIGDLEAATLLRTSRGDVEWAPYIDPIVSGSIKSEVRFPTERDGYREGFAFGVRPVDGAGNSPEQFFGVPLIVERTVPLSESGILERRIEVVRMSQGTDPETDELMQKLGEASSSDPQRFNQDLLVNLRYADLFAAYEAEGSPSIGPDTPVIKLRALIPVNPGVYSTEGTGMASLFRLDERQDTCIAYAVGGTVYRGRPILARGTLKRDLPDVNQHGEDAYFNVEALRDAGEHSGDVNVGNFVAVSLPLVGKKPEPVRLASGWDPSGNATREMAASPMMALDLAAVSTGRATGTIGRLVDGGFDTQRSVGILDVQLLTVSSEQLSDPESLDRILH